MRTFIIVVVVLLLIAGGSVAYIVGTTPRESAGGRFPLPAARRELLSNVSASADGFVFIPTAAAAEAKLRSNRVTRAAIEKWTSSQRMPRPWMVGRADLVIWKSGKRTSYALRLDPLRALIVRAYMALAADRDVRSNGGVMRINAAGEERIDAAELDRLLAAAAALPAGDAIAVQRENGRGAFPPIGRPAVTSARVTPAGIAIVSRSPRPSRRAVPSVAIQSGFPRASMLTAAFSAPPRIIEEMNRLVATQASVLLRDGGAIALYDVDTNKLLPRPREVIVLPATPERRAALQDFLEHVAPNAVQQALGFRIETADAGTRLLVAFDRDSIDRYRADTLDPPLLPATEWWIRIDPKRAVPMLQQIAGNPGLRYAAPRIFRSARDLRDWIEHLQAATSIEAADSVTADAEELRVMVSTP